MHAERSALIRFAIYVALYVLAAEFAVVFVSLPTDVTLIWPSAGIAYAVLVFHGLRWWPMVPVSILLMHLLVAPAPWAFVPFSLASNTIGTVLAITLVRSMGGKELLSLKVSSGFVLLLGGLVSGAVSGLIGALGMMVARLISPSGICTQWPNGPPAMSSASSPSRLSC